MRSGTAAGSKGDVWFGGLAAGLLVLSAAVILISRGAPTAPDEMTPITLSEDRLAAPPLPDDPTQLEYGRYLYWLNCMTCHGDQGQGLTDEFRGLWVEDHQNCWARGCHAGHSGDLGFPIPRTVPPVISISGVLPPFQSSQDLFEYLRTTHPPQHPGYLLDEEYWAVSAYLLVQNGRLPAGEEIGPLARRPESDGSWRNTIAALLLMLAGGILIWIFHEQMKGCSHGLGSRLAARREK